MKREEQNICRFEAAKSSLLHKTSLYSADCRCPLRLGVWLGWMMMRMRAQNEKSDIEVRIPRVKCCREELRVVLDILERCRFLSLPGTEHMMKPMIGK